MLGTRIVLDEEKILREGKYKLDELYAFIDNAAAESKLIKQDKYTYNCKGYRNDLSDLGIFTMLKVIDNEAITKNVKEWWLLDNGRNESNVIALAKEEGRGIWE